MSSNKPQTELAGAPAKDEAPRESLIDRIRPFILIFLLLFLPTALFHALTDYMYVCRIHLPAGTKVVDQTMIPQRSRLGEYIYGSVLIGKWHWDWLIPYLGYRHCIIPEGAEEIFEGAFYKSGIRDDLRSVSIPSTVKKIGKTAFAYCDKLTDVVIPGSVEQIGDHAFVGCHSLRRIVIPGNVKKIGNFSFWNCTGLREAVILDGVKVIGQVAFRGCTALRTVDIPDSVEWIGQEAFESCRSLEEIRLPAGMGRQLTEEEKRRMFAELGIPSQSVSGYMFANCTGLKKVMLPDGIERIEEKAFIYCTNLSEFNLPDSVISIGSRAFEGCRSLPPLTLGKRLQYISGGAFTGTHCALTVPDDHPAFRFEDGILYSKDEDGSELISCVSPPDGPCVVAPDVKIIRVYAFERCDGITEIRLPESLEEIGTAAFAGCTGLKRLELPDSLQTIYIDAFSGCSGLTGTLAIPPNVTHIGDRAFANCSGLTELVISQSVTHIGDGTFMFCSGLTELTIPPSVKEIRSGAFEMCTNLKHVTFPDSLKNIRNGAFYGCKSLDRETRDRLNTVNPNARSQSQRVLLDARPRLGIGADSAIEERGRRRIEFFP